MSLWTLTGYRFGGTNGFQWFNDVWCYDSTTNKWSQFDCIGYIPAPREGHAAALVDDVMYIFGGRTEEGTDLGDLAAFRISSRRWYTFQNMGPSPSPRSGHSMTTVGKSIFTVGGEPSSAATAVNDLGALYILDTTKIRYPADQQGQQGQQGMQRLPQGQRRPSLTDGPNPSRAGPSREGSTGPDQRKLMGPPVSQTNGVRSPPNAIDMQGLSGAPGSKLPRVAQSATGPPPQGPPLGPPPSRPIVDTGSIGRIRAGSVDPAVTSNSPLSSSNEQGSPATQVMGETNIVSANGRRTPTQQPQPRSSSKQENPGWEGTKGHVVKQPSGGSVDNGTVEAGPKLVAPPPSSPPPPSRQLSNHLSRRSSGRNSQTVVLLKELDSARNRNAWYASELELARKAGYVSTAASSQVLDGRGTETFDDEDRPLVEALLAMRTELATVQSAVDERAAIASKQVAEALKQRDAAVQEALYAKAKLAAHTSGSQADVARLDSDRGDFASRSEDMGKKLSTALHIQKDFQTRLDTARAELEVERKARQLADDSARSTSTRLSELESFKQKTSAELERLKAELHLAQRDAREHSVAFADAAASLEILKAEKAELSSQYEGLIGSSKEHSDTFESLRAVIAASEGSKAHLQSKLEEERSQREIVQEKLTNLKAEHEARTAELVATTQRLRDAEELAEKHANEATTHRHALLNGLDKLALRDNEKEKKPDDERLVALQNQVSASNALVKKYQQEADAAADRLRSAEERIAGLEQYQEQSSREGVGIRRQLQSALRETHALHTANAELKGKLAAQQLETNATTVQHNALKDILAERGISPTGAVRSRGLASPRTNTPDQSRIRDLEVQLATAATAHEETKLNFAVQAQESESMYREKLAQLESDYQSAVHYVKGTEKMLKQLKEQLNRHKAENTQLNSEIERLEDQLRKDSQNSAASAEWVAERNSLHKQIEGLEIELRGSSAEFQRQLEAVRTQVAESQRQRDEAIRHGQDTAQKLNAQAKSFDQLRSDAALLEQRAVEAEQKVSLLLDQVEHSVDTYRRQSRQEMGAVANGTNLGHTRNESSEVESIYEENHADARNSTALDNLASELETLRSHWEATNKNYRLSNNFDMETTSPSKRDDDAGLGLSESLADWRKKLDTEERTGGVEKARQV